MTAIIASCCDLRRPLLIVVPLEGGPDLASMLEDSVVKPMQESFQAFMRKLR